jgi:hypothetical protein
MLGEGGRGGGARMSGGAFVVVLSGWQKGVDWGGASRGCG